MTDKSSKCDSPTNHELRTWQADTTHLREIINERDRLYQSQFKAIEEKTSLALSASKEAVSKAETATEKRFEAVNEFRSTLSDQAANLIPRSEANVRFGGIEGKLDEFKSEVKKEISSLRESRSESGGKSQTWVLIVGVLLSVLGPAVGVLMVLLKT